MLSPADALFTAALGLTPPWYCKRSDFSADKSRLDLWLDFPAGSRFVCPTCSAAGLPVHDTVEKEWRHMDFFQHVCFLHARVPRVRCEQCGVLQVHVPWARPGSGFTLLFEALVMSMSPHMPVAAIARQVRECNTRLSHGGEATALEHVSMDMSPAFVAGVREFLPVAEITFDRYHIMKLANDALDDVRKAEARENPYLKGSKYLWLRNPKNLSLTQELRLRELRTLTHRTANAYGIVQGLRTFVELPVTLAEPYLKRWYHWARSSRIDAMKEFALTIKRHWDGILRFHETKMTAGFLEGINSLVQAAKGKARVYRTTENLITMIYLIAGKLDFQLTHLK